MGLNPMTAFSFPAFCVARLQATLRESCSIPFCVVERAGVIQKDIRRCISGRLNIGAVVFVGP